MFPVGVPRPVLRAAQLFFALTYCQKNVYDVFVLQNNKQVTKKLQQLFKKKTNRANACSDRKTLCCWCNYEQ